MRTKRKTEAHIMGEEAVRIVIELLPKHWSARPYHPDYGLDLAVEVFEEPKVHGRRRTIVCDTLGEHCFLQVKGKKRLSSKRLTIGSRLNVERFPLTTIDADSKVIDAFSFQLETSELHTVQRMGAAVPVLLALVDVEKRSAYFVCLNDYIDKIIVPSDRNYATKGSQVIHVPQRNLLAASEPFLTGLRFYAKRAKLMAAFQKFSYQRHEMEQTPTDQLLRVATHFAQILLRYDFWTQCDFWVPIQHAHSCLKAFVETGSPGLQKLDMEAVLKFGAEDLYSDGYGGEYQLLELLKLEEIRQLWNLLDNLGRIHEEVCREWFLPTSLGIAASYPQLNSDSQE